MASWKSWPVCVQIFVLSLIFSVDCSPFLWGCDVTDPKCNEASMYGECSLLDNAMSGQGMGMYGQGTGMYGMTYEQQDAYSTSHCQYVGQDGDVVPTSYLTAYASIPGLKVGETYTIQNPENKAMIKVVISQGNPGIEGQIAELPSETFICLEHLDRKVFPCYITPTNYAYPS